MMSQKLLTFILSITLHILVIGYFIYITTQSLSQSQKNQALQDAPVISIALTQAAQETQPEEIAQAHAILSKIKLDTVVEKATIVVPKKQKEIKKTVKEPVKPTTSTMVKNTETPKKPVEKKTPLHTEIAQQQKAGSQVTSLSLGNKSHKTQQAPSNIDSQLISSYREKLRQEIERNKQYPRRAKKMKSRGVSTVQFQLSQTGEISLVRLASSSGNELLDNAALTAVQKSRSVGKPPAGFAQSITLNIEFN
ncbi:energy transducer TonB [Providencia alcalifaciens]|uniref:energy transducer TonB n=1 Tax=Providencia alcalifaciens TaxID=126385 RepID=UPI0032DB0C87